MLVVYSHTSLITTACFPFVRLMNNFNQLAKPCSFLKNIIETEILKKKAALNTWNETKGNG